MRRRAFSGVAFRIKLNCSNWGNDLLQSHLHELVVVFGVSAFVAVIFHRLRQPAMVGFIVSGVLIGRSGIGLITDPARIESLAEIGLVFLLFSIGAEFSLKTLSNLKKAFFLGGALYCGLTASATTCICLLLGLDLRTSVLAGFLISLSSTALVMKMLGNQGELVTPQGQWSVAILLFQDILTVPLLLVLPLLAHQTEGEFLRWVDARYFIWRAIGVLIFVGAVGRWIVPFVLRVVVRTRIRELFLITLALLVLGSAWISAEFGLSPAIGAFVAGLLISESPYGHQMVGDLAPLREPFVALFFVSVGLLLNLGFALEHWEWVLGLSALVFLIKGLAGYFTAIILGVTARVAAGITVLLAQVGEFSFIVAETATRLGIFGSDHHQMFLAVTVVVMLVSPSVIRFAPIGIRWLSDPKLKADSIHEPVLPGVDDERRQSVLIVGFGINGQNLARVLKIAEIPYKVIEGNLDTVERFQSQGEPIVFGDGAKREVLEAAGIWQARLVVIAINEPQWVAKLVSSVRALRPEVELIVRCQYHRDEERLGGLGISEFVVAEAETSVKMFTRVLARLGVPEDQIRQRVLEMN